MGFRINSLYLSDGYKVGHKSMLTQGTTRLYLGEDPVTDYFDKVYTTNSKFEFYDKPEKYHGDKLDNLEIIKLF